MLPVHQFQKTFLLYFCVEKSMFPLNISRYQQVSYSGLEQLKSM